MFKYARKILSSLTLGFVPWPTVLALLAWAAIACQLGALASGRYRPGRKTVSPAAYSGR